ncbi:DNA primase [Streptomyces sp. NPDC101165]|uniref:DNA primase n=1 Tax=Streptomyces sp. NPDC101165 TaxID=3366119 RepID=UPI00381FAE4E
MNRTALGLALGAGYLLGRTKKMKLALAVGSLVAGKKLNLGPQALAELVQQQLHDNPQFKEIGDQLRQDLRGVGKAASGAMAERQMNAIADRLHGRTTELHEQLAGELTESGSGEEETGEDEDTRKTRRQEMSRKKAARKVPPKRAQTKRATAPGKTADKKTGPARKADAKRTASAGGATRGGRSGQSKGGDDR